MPKIFGEVRVNNMNLQCKCCTYSWVPTEDNIDDIMHNHMITCPVCRLLRGKDIQGFVDDNKNYRFLPKPILDKSYAELSSLDYLDIEIPVVGVQCKHGFFVKARDINEPIQCPKCAKRSNKGKSNQDIKDKPNQDIKDKPNQDIKDKPKANRTTKLKSSILALKGHVYDRQVMIKGLDEEDQCICHCIHCGSERIVPLSQLNSLQKRKNNLACINCKDNHGKDVNYIDRLINRYIGKIYNGLMIIDIYTDDSGITKCNVECVDSRFSGDNNGVGHLLEGLMLGDVINRKIICSECKSDPKRPLIRRFLDSRFSCRKFLNKPGLNVSKTGYNDIKGITEEDLYFSNKSLCELCPNVGKCKDKNNPNYNLQNIRNNIEYSKNIQNSLNDVYIRFPNIYSKNTDKPSKYEIKVSTGLQVFRDAYIGRDGQVYKFCKCVEHRTEMILSDNEVANFSHKECSSCNVIHSRFFNVDPKYLLSYKGK